MTRVWLSLGSNLSSPARRVRGALAELSRLPRTRLVRSSALLDTAPLGRTRQPRFANCCAVVETGLSPMGLLTELKRLEALAGRRPGPRWGPRPLDIDILFWGRARIRGRWLSVPHPRALERLFVVEGLAELAAAGLAAVPADRLARARRACLMDPSQNVNFMASTRGRR